MEVKQKFIQYRSITEMLEMFDKLGILLGASELSRELLRGVIFFAEVHAEPHCSFVVFSHLADRHSFHQTEVTGQFVGLNLE